MLLGKQEHLTSVRLEEIAAICKPKGIPIMVDAASEHIERPSPWLARGADLVIYSGGKFLRGPQTSGLLLGGIGDRGRGFEHHNRQIGRIQGRGRLAARC